MKIVLLLLLFFLSRQIIIADEPKNLNEVSCAILDATHIRVKQCQLYPDTNKLLKCGVAMKKLAKEKGDEKYLVSGLKFEKKAQQAWDRGGKIMIEREPITDRDICGYYLDCLQNYLETLPTFAPDGRPLKHEQFETWQQYDKILLKCAHGIYTVTTGIKKVEEKSPSFKRWKGKNTPMLSRITIKESKQVIFIDSKGGQIINVPLPDSASSDRTSQKYVFDSHKCLFELKEEDEKNKHINTAPVYVFSTDGKGDAQRDMRFTNKTKLNFKISSIEPIIQIKWKDVKNLVPSFHKTSTYISKNVLLNEQVFHVPKELRAVMTEKNMIAARTLLNPFKAIDSKELCDIQMGVEFLHGQVIWRRAEKIAYDYDIDFRPANRSERKHAKRIIRRMNNWSGSYTEEKGIYDSLNHPFHNSKYEGQARESYDGKEESSGILDVIVDRKDRRDDMSEKEKRQMDLWTETESEEEREYIDGLKLFTD